MTTARLASGFWVAAKLRQIQNAGGYASILAKGNDEAGTINLVLRARDRTLRLAVTKMNLNSSERQFEWRGDTMTDQELSAVIERERRFDRDQWFVEAECDMQQFIDIFEIKPD